jgi:hypothetical protein
VPSENLELHPDLSHTLELELVQRFVDQAGTTSSRVLHKDVLQLLGDRQATEVSVANPTLSPHCSEERRLMESHISVRAENGLTDYSRPLLVNSIVEDVNAVLPAVPESPAVLESVAVDAATIAKRLAAESPATALPWDAVGTSPLPKSTGEAAVEFTLARRAAARGDAEEAVVHLERAIAADPARAIEAVQEPSFESIRGYVATLVRRFMVAARAAAKGALLTAGIAVEAAEGSEGTPMWEPRAVLEGAELSFQRHTYAGYVSAAVASAVVRRLVAEGILRRAPEPTPVSFLHGVSQAVAHGQAKYEQAREAAASGDSAEAIARLEQAIAANWMLATEAPRDPAFESLAETARAMVNRLTVAARAEAESALIRAGEAIERAKVESYPRSIIDARAVLDTAETLFQTHTYTGYVEAAIASVVARRLAAERPSLESPSTPHPARTRPAIKAFATAARNRLTRGFADLWERLPLLTAMLVWLAAGPVLGWMAPPTWRNLIFPVWSIGLLGFVLTGFVRSLLYQTRRNR